MGTRKGYPFSARAHKSGLGILTNGILGLLGLGAWAVESMAKASSNASTSSLNTDRSIPDNVGKDSEIWEDFFEINLKDSPNELWAKDETYESDETIRNYIYIPCDSPYFDTVKAIVIDNHATNFIFTGRFKMESLIDEYLIIERSVMGRKCLDVVTAAREVRGIFDSGHDRIMWNGSDIDIALERWPHDGTLTLTLWTSLYNKEYFDSLDMAENPVANYTSNYRGEIIESDRIDENGVRFVSSISHNVGLTLSGKLVLAHWLCAKGEVMPIEFLLGVAISHDKYMHAKSGDLMLIKLDSGDIFEFKNMYDNESKTEDFGEYMMLFYKVTEHIDRLLSGEIVKMRISAGYDYIDINKIDGGLSSFINDSYFAILERLQQPRPIIYDGF